LARSGRSAARRHRSRGGGGGADGNQYSGKCLEVLYYSTDDFAPVGQYDCYGGANQKWWWS
jgi:hypothetical protein